MSREIVGDGEEIRWRGCPVVRTLARDVDLDLGAMIWVFWE